MSRRVGRELVRLHEDARRAHPLAAPEARRRRPTSPRYLHTVRGVGFRFTAPGGVGVTLRGRLLLALAYVLLLAIIALEVPLALEPARPRRHRGALAGALPGRRRGGHGRGRPRRPEALDRTGRAPRREAVRGRVRGHRPATARCWPTPPARDRLGTDYGDRPGDREGAARGGPSRTSAAATRSTRRSSPPPCRWCERRHARRRGAHHPERRGRLARHAPRDRSGWPRSACSCSASAWPRAS